MTRRDTIAVSCVTGIGSTILATPMLRALRTGRPEARILLLVRTNAARELLLGGNLADEILVCDYAVLRSLHARIGFIRRLRGELPGVFINAFPSNRTDKSLLAWLSGAPRRIGHRYPVLHRRNLGFLLNETVPLGIGLHDVEQNLQLLKPLGIDAGAGGPELWLPEGTDEQACAQLAKLPRPLIGLHPGSSAEFGMAHKRWPPECFGELGRYLARYYGASVLVFGGPEEAALKQHVCEYIGTAAACVDERIGLTAAMIGHMDGFVSNDSGLMHIAAVQGVPTVGIFGPTDARRTAPRGPRTAVISAGVSCSPCWRIETTGAPFHCERPRRECLERVTVGGVLAKLEALALRGQPVASGAAEALQ